MSHNSQSYRHSFFRIALPSACVILLTPGLFYGLFLGVAPSILLGLFLLIDAFLLATIGYGFLLFVNRLEVNEKTVKHFFFQGKEEVDLQEIATYVRQKRSICFYNHAGEEVLQVFCSLFNEQALQQMPQFAHVKKA